MAAGTNPRRAIRTYNLIGFGTLALFGGGFGAWSTTTELAGAVIARGNIVVESSVKKVQHPTGGVIGAILVKEGETVKAGQVVARLDETLTKASLGIVLSQREELTAREARLIAERDGAANISFPPYLLIRQLEDGAAGAMAGEDNLFQARRRALEGERQQLRERIAQTNDEIQGLAAQIAAKEKELKFIAQELSGVSDLYKKGLVTVARMMQLQRDEARLNGDRGNLVSETARAKGRISESELQILQLDEKFKSEALKDLRDVQGKLAETTEKAVAAGDQMQRVEVRAPQDGVVHQLAVHTVGGVVTQGETLMQIVPAADQLILESKVEPQDIDQVQVGATVHVRVMAGNQRTTPEISGSVQTKSADLTHEPQNERMFYTVRVTLAKDEVTRLWPFVLVAGMPAEAFIATHERTPLQYLLKPLKDQVSRAFRER